MRNLWMLAICIFFCKHAYAQEKSGLHIYYDTFTEQVNYQRNGKVLKVPAVRQGENIYFHIKEFNDFVFKSEVSYQDKIISPSSGGNLLGFIGGEGNGISSLLGMNFSSPAINDTDNYYNDSEEEDFETSRGSESANVLAFRNSMDALAAELKQVEQEISNDFALIKTINQSGLVRGIAAQEINKLKRSQRIPPSRIKELTREYLRTAYAMDITSEIKLSDVLDSMDLFGKYKNTKKSISNSLGRYKKLNNNILSLYEEIELDAEDTSPYQALISKSLGLAENTSNNLSGLQKSYNQLPDSINNQSVNAATMTDLKFQYEEVVQNDFEFAFPPIQAKGDEMNFTITIKNKEDNETVKFMEQSISVNGGLKINASIGLGFGSFFKEQSFYELQDDVIVSSETDQFLPMVASFIHFYVMPIRSSTLGGTFGVGFPLTGGKNIQAANFFLGPSWILGKTNRVIISGGVMGGKVRRLSQNYEVGNLFLNQGNDVPTIDRYELGWFVGLSYSILGN